MRWEKKQWEYFKKTVKKNRLTTCFVLRQLGMQWARAQRHTEDKFTHWVYDKELQSIIKVDRHGRWLRDLRPLYQSVKEKK